MNLFELFVKIGVDDQASNKISALSSKLGNGLKTAAKIGTAAVAATVTGIAALTTAAINNYAEYEQLVGGIDTLFKSSSQRIQTYAANAYKNQGISANEYMTLATSFSASLLQSLEGDTVKAAKYTDLAITDMSDNANKMGTSMEMIQNAYQGFAKQNYTMLDNLKLGYGGTKGEMQRLIADAAKLSDTVDAQSLSFANVVEAIHVMQTEMGITGTTALEAATTIQGSLDMMKASWQNVLTAIADEEADFGEKINQLVESVGVFAENIIPRVEVALNGVVKLITGLAPKIIEYIPVIVSEILPSVLTGVTDIFNSLIEITPTLFSMILSTLADQSRDILQTVVDTLLTVGEKLVENAPTIIDSISEILKFVYLYIAEYSDEFAEIAVELIKALADGLSKNLPVLMTAIELLLEYVVNAITEPELLNMLLESALAILLALGNGLIDALPMLLRTLPVIINNIVDFIVDAAPQVVRAGSELLLALVQALPTLIPTYIDAGIQIIGACITGIVSYFGNMFSTGVDIFNRFKEGINWNIGDAWTWGKDMIQNFIDGIVYQWENLKNTVSNVAQTVRDFLGFSEPKKGPLSNFHTYAPDMMQLFAQGIRDNENVITDQIEKSFDFGAQTIPFSYSSAARNGYGFGGTSFNGLTIQINGANVQNDAELADLIAERLQMMTDRRGAVYA